MTRIGDPPSRVAARELPPGDIAPPAEPPQAAENPAATFERAADAPPYKPAEPLTLPREVRNGTAPIRRNDPFIVQVFRGIGETFLEIVSGGKANTQTWNYEDNLLKIGREIARDQSGPLHAAALWNEKLGMGKDGFESALRRELTLRITEAQRAAGEPMTPADADAAAAIVLASLQGELETIEPDDAVRDTATKLGDPWPQRLEAARAGRRQDRTEVMLYVMAATQCGQLSNIPPERLDGLLAGYYKGALSALALTETLSALQRMPEARRSEIYAALDAAPKGCELYAYATLGRSHFALAGNDAECAGALARLGLATAEMQKLGSPDEIYAAFKSGNLGLESTIEVEVQTARDGNPLRLNVPLRFHPAVPDAERKEAIALLQSELPRYPAAAIERILAGEGSGFVVQILPRADYQFYNAKSVIRPDEDRGLGAYSFDYNTLRINTSFLSDQRAAHTVRHEIAHAISDIVAEGPRAGAVGDVTQSDALKTPLGQHWQALRERFEEAVHRQRLTLFQNKKPDVITDVEGEKIARDVGAVSVYAATGGRHDVDGDTNLRVEEFLADSLAAWADPTQRAQITEKDPKLAAAFTAAWSKLEAGDFAAARDLIINLAMEPGAK